LIILLGFIFDSSEKPALAKAIDKCTVCLQSKFHLYVHSVLNERFLNRNDYYFQIIVL